MATYQTVETTFERLYEELSEINGEYAPSSYTWFAPDRKSLREKVQYKIATPGRRLGEGLVVALIYECNGHSISEVRETATDAEVEDLFRDCMGLSD